MIAYHATNFDFDELNYETLVENIHGHNNGALGLWCGLKNDWIKGFGEKIYQVDIEGKYFDMTVDELIELGTKFKLPGEGSIKGFTNYRNELIAQDYDYIRLLEIDGRCAMIVVLNFEKANIVKL